MNKILFKKLVPTAQIPTVSRQGDAGWDVYSSEDIVIPAGQRVAVHTQIASAFDPAYVGLVWDRGGMAFKYGIKTMAGVIDSNYRGEWMIVLFNTSAEDYQIKTGDRIAQIIFQKVENLDPEIVEELPESIRGDGRYGSSGK